MEIVQKDWPWPHGLTERQDTKYIVIHHTAGPQNQDTQDIWDEHINEGFNGIGYHRVSRATVRLSKAALIGRKEHTRKELIIVR